MGQWNIEKQTEIFIWKLTVTYQTRELSNVN
jgi:hypothetical protein